MLLTALSSSTPFNLLLCFWEIFKLLLLFQLPCRFSSHCWHIRLNKRFSIVRWTPAEDVSPSKEQLSPWLDRVLETRDKPFTCEHYCFQKTCDCSKWQRLLSHQLPAISKQAENEQFTGLDTFPFTLQICETYMHIFTQKNTAISATKQPWQKSLLIRNHCRLNDWSTDEFRNNQTRVHASK